MMKKMRLLPVMCLMMSVMSMGIAQTVIKPGAVWPDDQGNHIQAHGGGIVKMGKYYYWYGEERRQGLDTNYRYVSSYRSEDLARWKFMGDALQLSDPEHLGSHWVLERPKVYFNRKAKTYVMYFHLDDARYKLARVGVAISKKPQGPFRYRESFRPLDKESRDIGQFIDDDGTAYLIFESRPTKGFFIAKLSDDHLHVEKAVCLVDAPLEGGAVVHYKGLYYAIGSALTGWRPNPNKYATARSLEGLWSEFRDIAPPGTNTYSSQSTMMLKVEGTKDTAVIFMADQWKPRTQWDSRYLWMPLEIGDGKLWLPEPKDWTLDVRTGEVGLGEEGSGASYPMDDRLREYKVSSPDGATVFEARAGEGGQLQYRVLWEGNVVIGWSAAGLVSGRQERPEGKVEVEKTGEIAHSERFAWPFGEQDSVGNNYREMVLRCRDGGLTYDIVARVFNGSVAFRYRLVPGEALCKFDHEVTAFGFGGNYTLYQYNQESVFTPTAIDTFTKTCDLPATLVSGGVTMTGEGATLTNERETQTTGKLFFSIGEAANDNLT
ncbi:MAG TPA: glycoside hydrolase family 97 N-terminal domain-containing protein, partial [Puia sp.]|nr:glycoside hydrolase family 97 N-terminal domain-containing protein [Puia sp.]